MARALIKNERNYWALRRIGDNEQTVCGVPRKYAQRGH